MAFDLSSIKRGREIKAPRIVVHGDSGVGKTTFGAGAPSPIVIQTEDGLGTLDVPHFPLAKNYADVLSAVTTLYSEEHGFQTCMVDSLDWLEPLIWAEVVRRANTDKIKSIEDFGYGKGYAEAVAVWKELMQGLTALRDDKGMAIVLVAHSKVVKFEDPLLPAFDTWTMKLHRAATSIVEEYVDIIGYAEVKTFVRTEDKGFNNKRAIASGSGQRVIHVCPNPAYTAKNRYGLPDELPLTWDAFAKAFANAVNPQATAPGAAAPVAATEKPPF
jgi:hypothetical protein